MYTDYNQVMSYLLFTKMKRLTSLAHIRVITLPHYLMIRRTSFFALSYCNFFLKLNWTKYCDIMHITLLLFKNTLFKWSMAALALLALCLNCSLD